MENEEYREMREGFFDELCELARSSGLDITPELKFLLHEIALIQTASASALICMDVFRDQIKTLQNWVNSIEGRIK